MLSSSSSRSICALKPSTIDAICPQFNLILHPKRQATLRPRFAPVVKPRRRDIGMTEPLLDLGDIGLVGVRIGCRRGAQGVNAKPVHFGADAGFEAVFHNYVAIERGEI